MIKCNVTACGIIVSSAVEKQNKEGGKFLAFTIIVPIEGKDKSVKELHIGVAAEGDQTTAANYQAGRRVTVHGNLFIKRWKRIFISISVRKEPLSRTTPLSQTVWKELWSLKARSETRVLKP